MAIGTSVSPAAPQPYQTATVSITGCAATTAYLMSMVYADGTTARFPFTSDGSGNATVKYVAQLKGPVSGSIRPAAECNCTTTAGAAYAATH